MRRNNSVRRSGFTLLEMVVVLCVMLLVTLLAVSRLAPADSADKSLEERVAPLGDLLHSARRRALSTGRGQQVRYDRLRRRWSSGSDTWDEPEGLKTDCGELTSDEVCAFYPDGAARRARIRFSLPDGETVEFRCSALTGTISTVRQEPGVVPQTVQPLWEATK